MKIGIDLGTTTSNVSVLLPATGKIQTIGPDPSAGVWKNGKYAFGDEAIALQTSGLIGAVDIQELDPRSKVLVIDWGGGTLDFSVVRKEGTLLREIDVDGDAALLGGSQLDRALSELVLNRDPELHRKVSGIEG